ncbi:MAG TPA: hypothetical protein VMS73_01720 [Anaerolineaceae bacterium]|nr:hypothetical protein [Anaerolineaceae bacterium]
MLQRNRFTPSPEARPPQGVRFTELRVEPWPDGRRVRVHVSITPFQKNPNLEAVITDPAGNEVARASIIETADVRFVFTMHIKGMDVNGTYTLSANLNYEETGQVDSRSIPFETNAEIG